MATYNGSDKRLGYLFQNGGGGGSSTLDGLSDVNITTATDGQVLAYDANADEWINSSMANPSSIASMSDTDIQSPTNGQTLVYNGTSGKWENASGGASSHTYSTTEQVVGTWIDGKPIYETTYQVNYTQGANWTSTGITKLDKETFIKATFIDEYNQVFCGDIGYDNGDLVSRLARSENRKIVVIILQYTKSTE